MKLPHAIIKMGNHKTAPKMTVESFGAPLKVLVGPDDKSQEFFIQKDLICNHSDFFKAACNKRWLSGRTNTINLGDDIDPVTFSIFLSWLLTGSLNNTSELVDITGYVMKNVFDTGHKASQDSTKRLLQLCQCYILGDYLGAEDFRNAVIDQLISDAQEGEFNFVRHAALDADIISYVFANTSILSPLRTLFVDIFSTCAELPKKGDRVPADSPGIADFWFEVAMAALRSSREQKAYLEEPWKRNSICCYFHEHKDKGKNYDCGASVPPLLLVSEAVNRRSGSSKLKWKSWFKIRKSD